MTVKSCPRCRRTLPLEQFHKGRDQVGRASYCKDCVRERGAAYYQRNREQIRAKEAERRRARGVPAKRFRKDYTDEEWKAHRRKQDRGYSLKKLYGITMEDYERMLDEQHGGCAVCGTPPGARRLHVDHDHETGKVRSLLCNGCNAALGHLKEDPARMTAMAHYIIRHRVGA